MLNAEIHVIKYDFVSMLFANFKIIYIFLTN